MDVPTRPGDALAQPTRARLFALLAELRRPAHTEELAERLGLHPNGVRTHLERLLEAGLLVRERERQARGRPRDAWALSPDAQPGGDPPTAYADLVRWLVRSLVAPDRLTYRLRNCPYRDAVRERRPLVCGLHRGLTRGMLDAIDPATRLTGFVPHDPDAAGCLIELRGGLAAATAPAVRG